MDGMVLVILALLGGVVLYLALSQRLYQRIDYSYLITQEEKEKQVASRLAHLEKMLGKLNAHEQHYRDELEKLIADTRQALDIQVGEAKNTILREVLGQPNELDRLLFKHSGTESRAHQKPSRVPPASPSHHSRTVGENQQLVNFLKGPRQQQIAEMLELGYSPQDASRMLGVSLHETELVESIIFTTKSA